MLPRFPPKRVFKVISTEVSKHLNHGRQELDMEVTEPSVKGNSLNNLASSKSSDLNLLESQLQNSSITVKIRDPEDILVRRFAELYTDSDSADVFIMCGKTHDVLKAHRFVLSCRSVYFRDALEVSQSYTHN